VAAAPGFDFLRLQAHVGSGIGLDDDALGRVFRNDADDIALGFSFQNPHVVVGGDAGAGVQDGVVQAVLAELRADVCKIRPDFLLPANTVASATLGARF